MIRLKSLSHVFLAACGCMAVAACQSTGNANPNNLDPQEVMEAQTVVSKACIVRRGGSSNISNISENDVIVFGIDKGRDGWRRVDSKVQGGSRRMSRGNIYYNLQEKKVYCGHTHWQTSGLNSKEIFSD